MPSSYFSIERMNESMIRKLMMSSLVLLLCVSGVPTKEVFAKTAPTFSLSTANASPKIDQTIQVKVNGKDVNDLYAYEINITYDTTRLKFVSSEGEKKGFTVEPIVKGNKIQLAHTQIGKTKGKNGNVTLTTLTFKAISEGSAKISLPSLKLVNSEIESTDVTTNSSVNIVVKGGKQNTGNSKLSDISNHWAKEAIEEAVKIGFVTGYTDGTFQPNAKTTRSEFAVMLSKALKLEGAEKDLLFKDANKIPAWARPYISQTVAAGILNGYDDNSFGPSRNITRAEMTVMIVRALGLKVNPNAKLSFADANKVGEWASPSVAAMYEAGLIKGRGQNLFAPNENATRAEAVNVILGMLNYKK